MRSWTRAGVMLSLVVAAGILGGCRRGERLYPVKGTVTLPDGSPVTAGKVVVDLDGGRRSAWGSVRTDGSFRLGTRTSSDGIPAGTHRVYLQDAVSEPPVDESSAPGGMAGSQPGPRFVPKPLVHPRYLDKQSSGITFTVPDELEWKIVVEPPKR